MDEIFKDVLDFSISITYRSYLLASSKISIYVTVRSTVRRPQSYTVYPVASCSAPGNACTSFSVIVECRDDIWKDLVFPPRM